MLPTSMRQSQNDSPHAKCGLRPGRCDPREAGGKGIVLEDGAQGTTWRRIT